MTEVSRHSRARAWPKIALLSVVLTATALLAACGHGDGTQLVSPDGQTAIFYELGDRTPINGIGKVGGPNLVSPGETISVTDFPDEVIVLNVFASWCGPCRVEMPTLEKVYEQTRDLGVQFIGINFRDNESAGRDFVTDRAVTFPTIYDYGGSSLAPLGVPVGVVPTTIVLDRQHRAAAVFLKPVSEDELRDVVERVAAEGAAPTTTPHQ